MTDEPAPPEQVQAVVRAAVAEVEADRTRLMDVVQAIQYRLGYIPKSAVLLVAEALGIHAVEVEDMVSFYAYLDREPKGRFHIRLSKTPVSLMNGTPEVAQAFEAATGAAPGSTSPDGEFALEWTADIGMADQEPAALINATVVTALTPADATAIVAALREGRTNGTRRLFPGSRADRIVLPRAEIAFKSRAARADRFPPKWTGGRRAGRPYSLSRRGHPGGNKVPIARPRRCRFPDRPQVETLPLVDRRRALCRLQR